MGRKVCKRKIIIITKYKITMGALKIDCHCNETQMSNIVNSVLRHINNSDRREIPDFDDTIGYVRVCVEFDSYLDIVSIRSSEVLNSDWDLLYEDTAVFTSRLNRLVEDLNNRSKEATKQGFEILKDKMEYAL